MAGIMQMLLAGVKSIIASSISYVTTTALTNSDASYSFTNVNIGAADEKRTVLLVVGTDAPAGTDLRFTSVTCNGIAMEEVISRFYTLQAVLIGIFKLDVPAGTTASFLVGLTNQGQRCRIATHHALDLQDKELCGMISGTVDTNGLVARNIRVQDKGSVLAAMHCKQSGTTTWTGLTEAMDAQNENSTLSTALLNVSADGLIATSADLSVSTSSLEGVLAGVAWGPEGQVHAISSGTVSIDVANAGTYTFGGMTLGPAKTGRVLIVVAFANGNNVGQVSNVTIGGITMAMRLRTNPSAASDPSLEFWTYKDDGSLGDRADVVVTYSANKGRAGCMVYSAYELISEIPAVTQVNDGGLNPVSVTLAVQKGDFLIGAAGADNQNGSTWAGLTEDEDKTGIESGNEFTTASDFMAATDPSYTVTNTHSGSPPYHPMIVAVWR